MDLPRRPYGSRFRGATRRIEPLEHAHQLGPVEEDTPAPRPREHRVALLPRAGPTVEHRAQLRGRRPAPLLHLEGLDMAEVRQPGPVCGGDHTIQPREVAARTAAEADIRVEANLIGDPTPARKLVERMFTRVHVEAEVRAGVRVDRLDQARARAVLLDSRRAAVGIRLVREVVAPDLGVALRGAHLRRDQRVGLLPVARRRIEIVAEPVQATGAGRKGVGLPLRVDIPEVEAERRCSSLVRPRVEHITVRRRPIAGRRQGLDGRAQRPGARHRCEQRDDAEGVLAAPSRGRPAGVHERSRAQGAPAVALRARPCAAPSGRARARRSMPRPV